VRLSDETMPQLDDMVQVNTKGGFAPAEAYAIHRERLKRRAQDVDQNVRARIERGSAISAADYVDMAQARARLIAAMDARMAERVEHHSVVRRPEPFEQARFMQGGERLGALEQLSAGRCELENMRAAIDRRRQTPRQSALLEPVEQTHQPGALDAEKLRHVGL